MPKQLTIKRKAEGPDYGQEAMPTKKLQKASSQPMLNIPPRPASATDSSLSESPPPPSLTSDSSIEDSPSSKSSASTASIENSSLTPVDEFYGMNLEQLKAYGRARGWLRTWNVSHFSCRI